MKLTKDDAILHFSKCRAAQIHKYPQLLQYKIRFYKAKGYVGLCNYRRKDITISTYWLESLTLEELLDTINHELAHAAVGPDHGHGEVWQKVAVEFGATPNKGARLKCNDPKHDLGKTTDVNRKYVVKFGSEIVAYSAKMRDVKGLYVKRRKAATLGKLVCVLNPDYVGN